jgi:hypothetical protein
MTSSYSDSGASSRTNPARWGRQADRHALPWRGLARIGVVASLLGRTFDTLVGVTVEVPAPQGEAARSQMSDH